MRPTRHPLGLVAGLAGLGLAALALASCGLQHAAATAHASTGATTTTTTTDATVDPMASAVAVAKQIFRTETGGAPTVHLLDQVAGDPRLRALLRVGDDAAAARYAAAAFRSTWAPEHMARLRLVRGGRTLLNVGVPWVVYPMAERTIARPGHPPVTIQVAEQDVIGFVRSMHNKHPVLQVVARDASGRRAVSLLGVAARADLPASGFVTLRGVRYEVRSFLRQSFASTVLPLHVWILRPTG
jgi:hypothetical protein